MLQQSKQVRRIGQDDAIAASHTAAAMVGNLPLASAIPPSDRDTTAKPQPASNGDTGTSKSGVQPKAPSQGAKSRPLPAVTVKAKAPQVMVKAKRKADDAEQSDQPPDKKPSQAGNGQAAGASGLAGLAAYGSGSGSDSPSASS